MALKKKMMIKSGKKTWTCRKCPPVLKPTSTTTKSVQNPVKEALRKYYNDVKEQKSDADLDKILKAYVIVFVTLCSNETRHTHTTGTKMRFRNLFRI